MKRVLLVLLLTAGCGDNVRQAALPDAAPAVGRPDGVALCYSAVADAHPATQAFFAALRAGDRSLRADSITALDAAATELPDEEEIHLMLGLAHLWRLAEPLPGETEPSVQLPSAIGARDHLQRAYQLCPTDHRIAAWLGPILVRFGRTLNNQQMIDEGLAVLDKGIAAYPSFVLFSRLLIYAESPRDAPEFQQALAAVIENTDACNRVVGDPACNNATVPHNREGAALFLGDVLTKAGKQAEAHDAYAGAIVGPDFPTWSFQPALHERLDNLDARIALYADGDAGNDPVAAWAADNQCALCHTR